MTTQSIKYRVGIDVGGTFTHAVAINSITQKLAGKVKVPTTHTATTGVGEGIVQSLKKLMGEFQIAAHEISLVAHSTTQATNSLLEGDVEKVGIVSVGFGIKGAISARVARLGKVELAPGRYLETLHSHVDARSAQAEEKLNAFLEELKIQKVRVVAVAAPFSIENASAENHVAQHIREKGFICTPTSEISQLYGLKTRTRTAAINLSILPKMLEVANHTEKGIRDLNIKAPLMIMRSDGGVMSVEEMRKRPILSLLSGPAAGIAAALRYLSISDGIFLEVGGTSTDISAIKNGRAMVRSATIGGNRTFLETLDCRTVGIGGGSVPRVSGSQLIDVGPRSAHIAGVGYCAFSAISLKNSQKKFVSPRQGDPQDYMVIQVSGSEKALTFTPTCAANVLGFVPAGDAACATDRFLNAVTEGFPSLGLGELNSFSEAVLKKSAEKVIPTVKNLLREYQLNPELVTLVGGGGGASAIVPFVAKQMGMKVEIALDSDVISAIGAALGLIRVVVERSCINPTQEDIFKLRQEAREQVSHQGASPQSIEVFIEVDEKKNVIRAEAQGAMEYTQSQSTSKRELSEDEISKAARGALSTKRSYDLVKNSKTKGLYAFRFCESKSGGLFQKKDDVTIVTDSRGVVRLRLSDAEIYPARVGALLTEYHATIEKHVQYGDGGVTYPFVFVLVADRIIDLSKLNSSNNIVHVMELETKEIPESETAVLLYCNNSSEEAK